MQCDSIDHYQKSASEFIFAEHNIAYWQSISPNPNAQWVCFIHGFPSASWDWQNQWQALAPNFHLFACDLLGFGASDKPANHRYTISEQANLVNACMRHCNIEQAHLVAHDYGVSVAQQMLTHTSSDEQILSICFLNGGLFAESHRPIFMQKLLKSKLGPLLVRTLGKSNLRKSMNKIFSIKRPPTNNEIDKFWALLNYKKGKLALPKLLNYLDERAIYRDKWVAAMQQASIPIGFINGVQDPISGQHMLDRFINLFFEFPAIGIEAGHYPQIEDAPRVNALIQSFLKQGSF